MTWTFADYADWRLRHEIHKADDDLDPAITRLIDRFEKKHQASLMD